MAIDEDTVSRTEELRRLRSSLDAMKGTQVTLLGDVMLDRYHHGYANNLNSIAPVPVLKIFQTDESPGAAAHIARGLNSIGLNVDFHTFVGDDREGRAIVDMLTEDGISTSGIESVSDRHTLVKIRFFGSRESLLDDSQILLQADRGPLEPIDKSMSEKLTKNAMKALGNSCALVISDYDNGAVSVSSASTLISAATKQGIPVIIDPKLTGLERSRGATVVLVEMRGMELMRRRLEATDSSTAASELISSYDWDALVVLGGINGVTLYQSEGEALHFDCSASTPKQQIGLHDAAATALAVALGNGLPMEDAGLLAAAACDCILTAEASQEFVDIDTLGTWLDEMAWQMQISER
ncbi:MAG: PfkB family carbohydrate kinase [Candidatus Thermoplasmatota archaeon]|nr:PfkB family carbohydrate kinase [Candidatus Thermoplasmatota archaeon]